MAIFGKAYKDRLARLALSRFYNVHPLSLFVYFTALFAIVFTRRELVESLLLAVMLLICAAAYARLRMSSYKFVAAAMIAYAILTPLFNHRGRGILFYFMDNPITVEAIILGVVFALLIFNSYTLFQFYNAVVTGDRVMLLFAKVMPKLALTVDMSVRLMFLYGKRIKEIAEVQGLRAKSANPLAQASDTIKTLLTWSLEEGMQLAQSIKVKGYDTVSRTAYARQEFKASDAAFLTLCSVVVTAIFVAQAAALPLIAFYTLLPIIMDVQINVKD